MNETNILGVNIADDAFAQAEGGSGLWRAGGAIDVGQTCIIDNTVATGKDAIILPGSGTAHCEHMIVGCFSSSVGFGAGGSGVPTTFTGVKGKAAVTGDFVVLRKGVVKARVDGTTDLVATAGAFSSLLQASATAGALEGVAALTTSFPAWNAFALEAYTLTTVVAKLVYIRGPM